MSFFWKKKPFAEKKGRRLKKKAVAWKKRPSPEKKGRRLKKMSATAFLLEKLLPSAMFETAYLKYTVVWRKSILPDITINNIVHNTLLILYWKGLPVYLFKVKQTAKPLFKTEKLSLHATIKLTDGTWHFFQLHERINLYIFYTVMHFRLIYFK
jgi:hypothetical protein